MTRRREGRLYQRGTRYYADFRDYAEVGGKQEALIPRGRSRATEDRDEATELLAARLRDLKAGRKRGEVVGRNDVNPTLAEYAHHHLNAKAQVRRIATVERDERALRQILNYFRETLRRETVRLGDLTVVRLTTYIAGRGGQPGRHGKTISAQTLLHELHALGNLFERAIREGMADENPVRRLLDLPRVERTEAVYLEPGEAARLLKMARELDVPPHQNASRMLHPLVATLLLTGGRRSEVLGLEVQDVDFDRSLVRFRQNAWRKLKSRWATRTVPLWPQLAAVLLEHCGERTSGLLFRGRDGGMLRDFRHRLDAAVARAAIEKRVTPHTLRHTYTAQRLQTTDHGQPISLYTVACELGHRDVSLIERTYGHLLATRDRLPVVEYREADVRPLRQEARHGA